MVLASAYFAGVYFFARALTVRRWHQVKLGFLPVTAFATTLGVATVLHWDRFQHDHVAFVLWAVLYFTAPFLVLGAWLHNRGRDPGTPDPDDVELTFGARLAAGIVGGLLIAASLVIFVAPGLGIGAWPWSLTPLTARVMAAYLALPGVALLGAATDRRWSSSRLIFQGVGLSFPLVLIGAARAWGEFDHSSPATYLLVVLGSLAFVGMVVLYVRLEMSRRATPAGAGLP
jgi:hypothetical protein